MLDVQAGTITLLFTDIEGSTLLLQHVGEQYSHVLAQCRQLLHTAFQQFHGHEVDTQGDAFFFAFARATDAVSAAVAAQRILASHTWPEGAAARVRMGVSMVFTRLLHDSLSSRVRAGAASGVGALSSIAFVLFALIFGVVSQHLGIFHAGWMVVGVTLLASVLLVIVAVSQDFRGSKASSAKREDETAIPSWSPISLLKQSSCPAIRCEERPGDALLGESWNNQLDITDSSQGHEKYSIGKLVTQFHSRAA